MNESEFIFRFLLFRLFFFVTGYFITETSVWFMDVTSAKMMMIKMMIVIIIKRREIVFAVKSE